MPEGRMGNEVLVYDWLPEGATSGNGGRQVGWIAPSWAARRVGRRPVCRPGQMSRQSVGRRREGNWKVDQRSTEDAIVRCPRLIPGDAQHDALSHALGYADCQPAAHCWL